MIEVWPGIFQVRIPLPFALNHVHCYLLRGRQGWTMVDTGLHTPAAEHTWEQAMADAGIGPGDLQQVVLTHTHPDHLGMAGYWQQRTGVAVRASPREIELARAVWFNPTDLYERMHEFFTHHGLPRESSQSVVDEWRGLRPLTMPHPEFTVLLPGATIEMGDRTFTAIATAGHSDGHLVFYCEAERLVLVGDQVLRKITPNVSLWPREVPDPLERFLSSLEQLDRLDAALALPGHGPLIDDWHGRIAELRLHHQSRLALIEQAAGVGSSAFEVARAIFPADRFSNHDLRFALAETLAHLELLVRSQRVERIEGPTVRYRRAA